MAAIALPFSRAFLDTRYSVSSSTDAIICYKAEYTA